MGSTERRITLVAFCGFLFGIGSTVASMALPQAYPHWPPQVWQMLFWGGITVISFSAVVGGYELAFRPRLGGRGNSVALTIMMLCAVGFVASGAWFLVDRKPEMSESAKAATHPQPPAHNPGAVTGEARTFVAPPPAHFPIASVPDLAAQTPHSQPVRPAVHQDLRLLVECRSGIMPSKFPESGDLYVMDLFYSEELLDAGLGRIYGQPGADTGLSMDREGVARRAFRCEVTNYADAPLANVRIVTSIKFLNPQVDGSLKYTDVLEVKRGTIYIPKVDPGPAGRFTFYITNASRKAGAQVLFPEVGTGQFLSEDQPRTLGVVISGDMLTALFAQPLG